MRDIFLRPPRASAAHRPRLPEILEAGPARGGVPREVPPLDMRHGRLEPCQVARSTCAKEIQKTPGTTWIVQSPACFFLPVIPRAEGKERPEGASSPPPLPSCWPLLRLIKSRWRKAGTGAIRDWMTSATVASQKCLTRLSMHMA